MQTVYSSSEKSIFRRNAQAGVRDQGRAKSANAINETCVKLFVVVVICQYVHIQSKGNILFWTSASLRKTLKAKCSVATILPVKMIHA